MATYGFSTYSPFGALPSPEICRRYAPRRAPVVVLPAPQQVASPAVLEEPRAYRLADELAVALNEYGSGKFAVTVFPAWSGRDWVFTRADHLN